MQWSRSAESSWRRRSKRDTSRRVSSVVRGRPCQNGGTRHSLLDPHPEHQYSGASAISYLPQVCTRTLSWAKLFGVVLLLVPVPARLKEWAYAGFAIDLAPSLIAHLSVGDGPEAWGSS